MKIARGIGLVLLGLLIYAQTFHFGFVFDDHIFIVTNPYIKTFNNLRLIWHKFPMTRLVGMYSFALNYRINQLNAEGYHIFNFIVHLACTALVWALSSLLFKITRQPKEYSAVFPFMIAALFLVHPGQTQAVTYISQRFESMATMFYLGTLYAYLRGRTSTDKIPKVLFFALAGLLALLGIMTKEVVITVPAMIWACEWIFFPGEDRRNIYRVLVYGGILFYLLFSHMVHAGLDIFSQTHVSESHDGDVLTPWRYFLTQARVFLTFLRLLVLPIHQNLDYDYPASTGLLHPPLTLVGLGVIAVIIFLIIKLRPTKPLTAFGLAWMLITFAINLVPRTNVIFEHKLYLISFGFFLAAVSFLSGWVREPRTLAKVLWCFVAVLAFVSFERNKVWANELSVWQDSFKNSPHKARVNANLGRMYGSLGRYTEAIEYLSQAIELNPDNITYENRGIIYLLQGRLPQAMTDLNKSISMDPDYFLPYTKRAWVYYQQHDYKAAMTDLNHAIHLEPYFTEGYLERGVVWAAMDKTQEALKDFQMTLKIDPFNTQAKQYTMQLQTKAP